MATTVTTTDATTAIPPSQSLYLQNLPEKLQKHDLKRNLYMLFSTYGPVLDVTAVKTSKMRGQAHVLFRDANTATQAMRHTQGMDFFGRELKVTYAKSRSQTLAKLTGTFHDEQQTAKDAATAKTSATGAPSSLPAPPGGLPAPPGGLPAPPGGLPAPPGGLPPPPGLPQKVNGEAMPKPPGLAVTKDGAENAPSPAVSIGQKRQRDESEDEAEGGDDAPMEEDSDGGDMDMSDSD